MIGSKRPTPNRTASFPRMRRMSDPIERIPVRDEAANHAFRRAIAACGISGGAEWAERYVDYEWNRARHLFTAVLGDDLAGCRALEIGCYVGGTAIVMAALGARVVGIDAEARWPPLAELNARRYRVADRTEFRYVRDL